MSETRKIAAILVADAVGYGRFARADDDPILQPLRALRSDLIDPAIAAHHGCIVKRTADGRRSKRRPAGKVKGTSAFKAAEVQAAAIVAALTGK